MIGHSIHSTLAAKRLGRSMRNGCLPVLEQLEERTVFTLSTTISPYNYAAPNVQLFVPYEVTVTFTMNAGLWVPQTGNSAAGQYSADALADSPPSETNIDRLKYLPINQPPWPGAMSFNFPIIIAPGLDDQWSPYSTPNYPGNVAPQASASAIADTHITDAALASLSLTVHSTASPPISSPISSTEFDVSRQLILTRPRTGEDSVIAIESKLLDFSASRANILNAGYLGSATRQAVLPTAVDSLAVKMDVVLTTIDAPSDTSAPHEISPLPEMSTVSTDAPTPTHDIVVPSEVEAAAPASVAEDVTEIQPEPACVNEQPRTLGWPLQVGVASMLLFLYHKVTVIWRKRRRCKVGLSLPVNTGQPSSH